MKLPRRSIIALAVVAGVASPGIALEPGWHLSPLPGEGDRASMGCARGSTNTDFACLAVRCEDDYSAGIHVYSSRPDGDAGLWDMTLDREDRSFKTTDEASPYGAKLEDEGGWLLDRIQQGTFIYLRHAEDQDFPFRFIDLGGSFQAIAEALYWCAPRTKPGEQNVAPDVEISDLEGEPQ